MRIQHDNVRSFSLENANGDKWDLNNLDNFLFYPEGLGADFANDSIRKGVNYTGNRIQIEKSEISGNLLLGHTSDNAYNRYLEFAKLLDYQPLRLHYQNGGNILGEKRKDFIREVYIKSVGKTEIDFQKYLFVPITFECMTPWFIEKTEPDFNFNNMTDIGKIYHNDNKEDINSNPVDTGWPGHYWYSDTEAIGYTYDQFDFSSGYKRAFKNESQWMTGADSSPYIFTISATKSSIVNPYWELIVDGEIVMSDGYNLTIPKGQKLIVSTIPQKEFVILSFGGNSTNVWQFQDLTRDGFVKIPKGFSQIRFNIGKGDFDIMYREEYILV